MRYLSLVAVVWTFVCAPTFASGSLPTFGGSNLYPKNVILFVGDGMGFEHIRAAQYFANGGTQPFNFQNFPHFATVGTANFHNQTTDSAAAGTAMATGQRVSNSVISRRIPGDGSDLPTSLEFHKALGRSTGLVTKATEIVDATPAAFGAHRNTRSDYAGIFNDYMTKSRPNVLFGRTHSSVSSTTAINNGYTVLRNQTELQNYQPTCSCHVLGHWSAANEPSLALMTQKALANVSHNPKGFFLMIEDEDPDTGGHANNLPTVVNGVLSLVSAIQVALDWAAGRNDTLILVTADHETGGLNVLQNNGAGVMPTVSWTTTGHTLRNVGLWAVGPNAHLVSGHMHLTDIYNLTVQGGLPPASWPSEAFRRPPSRTAPVPEPADVSLLLVAGTPLILRRRRVT